MPAGSVVMADIHSHPSATFGSDNSAPSSADWKGTDKAYIGPGYASADSFSMYVISPKRSLAEFDYNRGRPKSAGADNKRDAESKCEDAFNYGPSTGDLATAQTISELGGGQVVTSYIIAPDGELLECDGYDRPDWMNQAYGDDTITEDIKEATKENLAPKLF